MEDSLITRGSGVSTIPENCAAAVVVATVLAEAVETVVVAVVELFIDPDRGTAIDSDRVTVSDWVVVLDSVRGLGLCSDWVVAIDSESSDLAVAMDSDWVAARDSDRVVAMDSDMVATTGSDAVAALMIKALGHACAFFSSDSASYCISPSTNSSAAVACTAAPPLLISRCFQHVSSPVLGVG